MDRDGHIDDRDPRRDTLTPALTEADRVITEAAECDALGLERGSPEFWREAERRANERSAAG